MKEITTKLISLRNHSSIASFESGEAKFALYGDRRMTENLREYVGEEIILYIEDEYTRSWRNLEENFIEEE